MKYLLYPLLLLLIIFSYACNENKVTTPSSIINQETMSNIVMDLSLLEASRGLNILNKEDTVKRLNIPPDIPKYQDIIFKKYGVTKSSYDSSFLFYAKSPKQLLEIFEEAGNLLSAMQAKSGEK
ncbi:MAG: DUF4296 domain-containing protein [Bacteroidia bacterium]|nr:DUF4296 domain-containing protein [Bacteroidia bacterium]